MKATNRSKPTLDTLTRSEGSSDCARTLLRQSGNRDTYFVPDLNNQRLMLAESRLERDYGILLLNDPEVLKCDYQPESIYPYPDHPKRRYTPDYAIVFRNRPLTFVDTKYRSEAESDEFQAKLPFIKQYYSERNCEFKVVTEQEVYGDHRLANFTYLARFKHSEPSLRVAQVLAQAVDYATCSVTEAIQHCKALGIPPAFLPPLVKHSMIKANLATHRWPEVRLDFSELREADV